MKNSERVVYTTEYILNHCTTKNIDNEIVDIKRDIYPEHNLSKVEPYIRLELIDNFRLNEICEMKQLTIFDNETLKVIATY